MSSFNEVSGRYVKIDYSCYVPSDEALRRQEGKPGAYKFVPILDPAKEQEIRQIMNNSYERSYDEYERLLKLGLAREVARNVLPFGFYTEFMYSTNARSLMNFLSLRNADNALLEIRAFAIVLEKIFAKKMPITHEYFLENKRIAP
jgi:thymidylate synthase (FAD)